MDIVSSSEYPPLGNDVFVSTKMADQLGPDTLSSLLQNLWRGDCQTCGSSLISGPVSVHVEAWLVIAHATLHHPTCKEPDWDDGEGGAIMRQPNYGPHSTYVHTGLVADGMPITIVNPSLEIASLTARDDSGWELSTISLFRDYHKMFPGGPIPMPPSHPVVGVSLELSDDTIVISHLERWLFRPGPAVIDAARKAEGVLFALSTAYHGQSLAPDLVSRLLQHPTRTALGWLSAREAPARGAPAAEYIVYRNDHFAMVGIVRARTSPVGLTANRAREWGKKQVKQLNPKTTPRFIDHPASYADEKSAWFMDSLSLRMYVVVPAEDGWRLVESYSRYGGYMPEGELSEWGCSVMQHKSEHRLAKVGWVIGPNSSAGMILLAHLLPAAL